MFEYLKNSFVQSLQLAKLLNTSKSTNDLKITQKVVFVSISASIAIPLNIEAVICWVGLGNENSSGAFARAPHVPLYKKFLGKAQKCQKTTNEKDEKAFHSPGKKANEPAPLLR